MFIHFSVILKLVYFEINSFCFNNLYYPQMVSLKKYGKYIYKQNGLYYFLLTDLLIFVSRYDIPIRNKDFAIPVSK